ncbi:MAG: glucosyl-3-phosphoglycerate synthase [Verrucomicrobiia bacterium]|jgi:glucosyl-3-phosphoglycerate synthase
MADFRQNVVPTFTRLESENLEGMEQRILKASVRTPIGVIIPALYDDLASPAMQQIVTELANMPFLRRVYISLDRASAEEYRKAYDIVRPLQDRARLLWNDAPAVQRIVENVNSVTQIGGRGKGRAVWMALGYALGKAEVSVLAFHDADIVTYDRAMMVRLLYPVVHLRYQFAKAFYARHSDRLNGRVARLFYFPFVKALRDILGQRDFVDYMADFRYPLSGEFATFATIANELRFPSDWGIEVGILSEMYRIVRTHRLCQVEIAPRYDHKHQQVGVDPQGGLLRMVADIARTFYTQLASSGCVLSEDFLVTLKHTYMVNARAYVRIYEGLAEMNKIERLDSHAELRTIESFASILEQAFQEFHQHPLGSPLIPEWRRLEVALDGILTELVTVFENPNGEL